MYRESVIDKKRAAKQILNDVGGVGGIGVTWDSAGQQMLQVDLEPGSNRKLIENRLSTLRVPYVIRTVSGFVRAG